MSTNEDKQDAKGPKISLADWMGSSGDVYAELHDWLSDNGVMLESLELWMSGERSSGTISGKLGKCVRVDAGARLELETHTESSFSMLRACYCAGDPIPGTSLYITEFGPVGARISGTPTYGNSRAQRGDYRTGPTQPVFTLTIDCRIRSN